MLAREPSPGATEAGVNLVANQKRAVLVANFAEQFQEADRRDVRAATTLNWLDQNRANFVFATLGGQALLEFGQVGPNARERDEAGEPADLAAERRAEIAAPSGVERAVTEAVVGVFERDHARTAGGEMGGLERGLDRLEAGVAKDRFAGALGQAFEGESAEFAGQLGLECVGVDVAHRVQQLGHLALAGGDNAGVGVAGRRDGKRRGEVEILAAVVVPNTHALGPLPDDRPTAVRLDERDVARLKTSQLPDGFVGLFFHDSNALFVRRPDELVHLQLEPHAQLVPGDTLDKFAARNRRVTSRHRLERLVLLMRLKRGHPG